MPAPTPTSPDETELRPSAPEGGSAVEATTDRPRTSTDEPASAPDPDAPLSFVPRPSQGDAGAPPVRIRTGRYGELEEHELLRLLDSIEDERARARFRESVYISVFIWIAIALVTLYGPKYLWHAPRVVLPSDVLRARELTTLTAPTLSAPRLHTAPPTVDTHTLEHLRATEPKPAPPPPRPAAPVPVPRAETQPATPAAPSPNLAPSTAPPNLPSAPAPVPRTPPPVVAEAPRPQPSSRPNFNAGSQLPGDSIQRALQNAPRGGGAPAGISNGGRGGSDLGAGYEVLSDTQGVNFGPYITRILHEIYDQWIPLIPEEARPPLSKSGITMIRFSILPDGTIGAMHLDGSTHDDALNKAAWGSITGVGQFPPLPTQFHGPNLELRIHYLVNRQTE